MNPDQIQQLIRQKDEVMRLLAILVERAGGEVRITPEELSHDRTIEREGIGFTGVLLLRARRA